MKKPSTFHNMPSPYGPPVPMPKTLSTCTGFSQPNELNVLPTSRVPAPVISRTNLHKKWALSVILDTYEFNLGCAHIKYENKLKMLCGNASTYLLAMARGPFVPSNFHSLPTGALELQSGAVSQVPTGQQLHSHLSSAPPALVKHVVFPSSHFSPSNWLLIEE
jgi:hypothetical protein